MTSKRASKRLLAAVVAVVLGAAGLVALPGSPVAAAPGDLDATFGDDEARPGTTFQPAPGPSVQDYAGEVSAFDNEGRILLGGSDVGSGGDRDAVLARLDAEGFPDLGFAGGATGTEWDSFAGTAGSGRDDRVTSIAVQPDSGEIFVATTWNDGSTETAHVRVTRLLPDGGSTFVVHDLGPGFLDAKLAFRDFGTLILAAAQNSVSAPHDYDGVRLVALDPATLTPVNVFGGSTAVMDVFPPDGSRAVFQSMTIDSAGDIFLGAHEGAGTPGAHLFKVDVTAGTLDAGFDGDGHRRVLVSGDDWITSMATNPVDDRIAIAGRSFPTSYVGVVDGTTGALDGSFDGDGVKALSGAVWTVTWDGEQRLVYGREHTGAVGRLTIDGTADTTFSADGETVDSCGAAGSRTPGLLVTPTRIITTGDCANEQFAAAFQAAADPISAVEYTISPLAAAAGREKVDLSTLDVAGLDGGFDALVSAPLRGSPLRGSPLRGSPLRGSPLRGSPLRGSPLRGSPLRGSPLRGSPLPVPVLLSSIPLIQETATDPTWEQVLVGTPFEGAPLQSVTLQQVLESPDAEAPTADDLTLAHVDLSTSPLRGSTFASTFLWGIPLPALPTPLWYTGADPNDPDAAPNPVQAWCDYLTYNHAGFLGGRTCGAGASFDPNLHDLLDLELFGLDLSDYYRDDVSLTGAPLRGSPLRGSPLGSVYLRDAELSNTPLGTIVAGHPAVQDAIVTCGTACENRTIAQVQDTDPEHIAEDARIADLLELLPIAGGLQDVTLGEVLAAFIQVENLPFDEMSLGSLLDQAELRATGNVVHTLSWDRACEASGTTTVTMNFPEGMRPVPGTATIATGGDDAVELEDPAYTPFFGEGDDVDDAWGWELDDPCGAQTGTVEFTVTVEAEPSERLRGYVAEAIVELADDEEMVDFADGEVIDAKDTADDSPATATAITSGFLYTGHISHPGDIDNLHVPPVAPGSRVEVTLSHIPAGEDFDLVVYGDETDVPMTPLRGSPLRGSPLRGSPLDDTTSDAQATSEVAPEGLADVPLRGSPLRGSSITRGSATESVALIARAGDTAGFDVQVSGFNLSNSRRPYVVQVRVTPGPEAAPCIERTYGDAGVPGTPTQVTAETQTLVLVNQERMGDIYGPTPVETMMTSIRAMLAKPGVNGAIVPVETDAAVRNAYSDWDAAECSPEAANAVVEKINALVDTLRPSLPNLRHIVLVGSDEVIPHARVNDRTDLGNQLEYTQYARFNDKENPISAAFFNGYLVTDEAYGDFDPKPWPGGRYYVSDVGLGRLVETPAEVQAIVDRFNADDDGALDPSTGYVAGYDFLKDAARAIEGSTNALLAQRQPGETAPTPVQAVTSIGEDWTAAIAKDGINGAAGGIASVNAHYDHFQALPALAFNQGSLSDLLTTGQLDQELLGSILFTIGCQSGLNIPDVAVGLSGVTGLPPDAVDWAQKINGLGGVFNGNTGTGYGDTDAVAYSERLYAYFAENLATRSMTLGQAAMFAKNRLDGELLVPGVYDAKAIEESTVWGLPFWRIGASGGVAAPALPELPGAEPALVVATSSLDESITTVATPGARGTFWTVPGHRPQVSHQRPIQPRITVAQPVVDGLRVHGVIIEDLESTDHAGVDPSYSTPTIDLSANEPEAQTADVVFPAALQAVNHVRTPAGPVDNIVLAAGQFFAEDEDGTGTQRLFSNVQASVLKSNSHDFDQPIVGTVRAGEGLPGGKVRIDVTSPSTDVVRAVALYRFGTFHSVDPDWRSVELTAVPGGFSAEVTPPAGFDKVVDMGIQLADAAGNVGLSWNKGPGYRSEWEFVEEAPAVTVTPTPDAQNLIDGPATVAVDGQGLYEAIVDGAPARPVVGAFVVAAEGPHSIVVRPVGSDDPALSTTVTFTIDNGPPIVTITAPQDGATYTEGSVPAAAYSCTDTSGVVPTCEPAAALGTSPGAHTFTVNAIDAAGRTSSASVSYTVVSAYTFEGFFAPVDNLPTVNKAKRGSAVPAKFRVYHGGSLVTDVRALAVRVTPGVCASSATSDPIEAYTIAPAGSITWDAANSQFVYVHKTEKTPNLCRRVSIVTADGATELGAFLIRTT